MCSLWYNCEATVRYQKYGVRSAKDLRDMPTSTKERPSTFDFFPWLLEGGVGW